MLCILAKGHGYPAMTRALQPREGHASGKAYMMFLSCHCPQTWEGEGFSLERRHLATAMENEGTWSRLGLGQKTTSRDSWERGLSCHCALPCCPVSFNMERVMGRKGGGGTG